MNKNTILLLIIFVFPLIAYFYFSHTEKNKAVALTTTKPQIIKFSSTMCGECKRMEVVMDEIYPKYKDKLTLVQVSVQNNNKFNKDMISKYNITLVPTIILLKKNNVIYKRIEGYVNPKTFDTYLKELSND